MQGKCKTYEVFYFVNYLRCEMSILDTVLFTGMGWFNPYQYKAPLIS